MNEMVLLWNLLWPAFIGFFAWAIIYVVSKTLREIITWFLGRVD